MRETKELQEKYWEHNARINGWLPPKRGNQGRQPSIPYETRLAIAEAYFNKEGSMRVIGEQYRINRLQVRRCIAEFSERDVDYSNLTDWQKHAIDAGWRPPMRKKLVEDRKTYNYAQRKKIAEYYYVYDVPVNLIKPMAKGMSVSTIRRCISEFKDEFTGKNSPRFM